MKHSTVALPFPLSLLDLKHTYMYVHVSDALVYPLIHLIVTLEDILQINHQLWRSPRVSSFASGSSDTTLSTVPHTHTRTHTHTHTHTPCLTKQADGGQTEFSVVMTCGVALQVPEYLFACGLCVYFRNNK